MKDIKYWIWLNQINDVGVIRAKQLLDYFKTPDAIWNAKESELKKVQGIGPSIIKAIMSSKNETILDEYVDKINKFNVDIITLNSSNYPIYLKNIYSPPILLYSKGIIDSSDTAVAIVGARQATRYGMDTAYSLAGSLAKAGVTVVSGMARGIDTAAHNGALDAGGRTIAVLGCGIDIVYPPENKQLASKILQNGAIITEYNIGTKPESKNFPQRNRIISGMSLGVLVVEAHQKSGSLITADFALEQGREVFAIPGQITSKLSQGTNNLIKQGAKLVNSVEDILEEININPVNINQNIKEQKDISNLNNDEYTVYHKISDIPVHLAYIEKHSGLSVERLNAIITLLELKGFITQLPGKQFIRA